MAQGNWVVQVGKGKGSYVSKYVLPFRGRALRYYSGLNIHSGYKKRLIDPQGRVVARFISQ